MENPITTTETDAEHPAPVSIDGVGDGDVLLPCADALATAIEKMTTARTSAKAVKFLICAMLKDEERFLQINSKVAS